MSNIIKHLVSKMSKLELEKRNTRKPIQEGANRNPTPFRRPSQPSQILQRPRKNPKDQNVQHPLNNFVDENQHEEEDEGDDNNMIGEPAEDACLTLSEYEDQLMLNVFPDQDNGEVFGQDDPKQSESQVKRYNLRSKPIVQKYQPKASTSKKNADQNLEVSIPIPMANQLPIRKLLNKATKQRRSG